MTDDSNTDEAVEDIKSAVHALGKAVDKLDDDSSTDEENTPTIPSELESTLNWATITKAPYDVDGDYIAAWDDFHTLQSRNVTFDDARFTIRYITWGDDNEYDDSHVEGIIGDSKADE